MMFVEFIHESNQPILINTHHITAVKADSDSTAESPRTCIYLNADGPNYIKVKGSYREISNKVRYAEGNV